MNSTSAPENCWSHIYRYHADNRRYFAALRLFTNGTSVFMPVLLLAGVLRPNVRGYNINMNWKKPKTVVVLLSSERYFKRSSAEFVLSPSRKTRRWNKARQISCEWTVRNCSLLQPLQGAGDSALQSFQSTPGEWHCLLRNRTAAIPIFISHVHHQPVICYWDLTRRASWTYSMKACIRKRELNVCIAFDGTENIALVFCTILVSWRVWFELNYRQEFLSTDRLWDMN